MKRPLRYLAVMAGLALLSPAEARADKLDLKLNEETPKVIKYLKDHGYKNVGVLHFRSQKATEKAPRFDAGAINVNMAERLENLLVMHDGQAKNPEQPAYGVIHDASATARKEKVGAWFTNEAERKKLFKVEYPLAWGDKKVKADAFLTGKVSISEDLKTTRVTIECFDAKAPEKLVKVESFTCPTDRNIVREFNLPYTLTKAQHQALARGLKSAKSREQAQQAQQKVDDVVLQQAQQQQKQGNKPLNPPGTQDGQATPDNIGGIKFSIKANDTAIELRPNSSQQGMYEMDCPARGSTIVMDLENTSDKELGVVLMVGGQSTIGEQREPAEQARKWLVPPASQAPKNVYHIKGFYTGEKFDALKKFVVMSKEEAKQSIQNGQQLENLDLIEVIVFDQNGSTDGQMTISRGVNARGLRGDAARKARSSFQTLKRDLLRAGRFTKARGRDGDEVIVPDKDTSTVPPPNEKDFPNALEVKRLQIRLRPAGVATNPPPGTQPQPEPPNN